MKTTTHRRAPSPVPQSRDWLTLLSVLKSGLLAFALVFGLRVSGQTSTTATNFSVNMVVPDALPSGLASSKVVSTPITYISGLKVSVKLNGTWNGDIYCYLTHSSGYTVLLNRVGRRTGSSLGYGDEGFDVTFDDVAANGDIHIYRRTLNTNHSETTPISGALTNVWAPDGRTNDPAGVMDTNARPALLSSFNGLDPNGEWVLFVADMEAGDIFTLDNWGLEITGYTPPSIVANPVSGTNECSTGATTFSVTATGSTNLVYQWRHNGTSVSGGTDSTLALNNPTFNDAGQYSVVITNNYGALTSSVAVLTMVDTTRPSFVGVPANTAAPCDNIPVPPTVTATDTCDPAPTVTLSETSTQDSDATKIGHYTYTITRSWTATDSSGNLTNQSQQIAVSDSVKPSLAGVPADTLASCDNIPAPATVTATDNCDPAPKVTLSETSTQDADVAALGHYSYVITRTWTAMDVSGNSTNQSQHITVSDTTKPVVALTGSDALTNECHSAFTDPGATASDNCAPTVSVVTTGSVDANSVGTYTLTYTATDPSGNIGTTNRTVYVIDTTPPTITCPANISVYTTNIAGTMVSFSATATDLCSTVTVTYDHDPGSVFPVGTNTVIATATDASGNHTNSSFTVTVLLDHVPVVGNIYLGAVANHPRALSIDKILGEASDPDADTMTVADVSATSTNGGTVMLTETNIIYTPAANYAGDDLYTYTISDGHSGISTGSILVRVLSAAEAAQNQIGTPTTTTNGTVVVRFAGIPGYTYDVERSHDQTTWTAAGNFTVPASGIAVFTDGTPGSAPYYYRTAQQ